ncbi:CoA transferase [Pueribacillus theae]|uniref:CoA transferase n=1 Tax=Pueribacillus theae TaxID=2171751 RepID=A0A2U1JYH4_9BACI|nr:CaiB/BaiF CoA-transferase family protein [Pueribacillus theae]PWA09999.1 CoA transferase [Pueribacillus theae]
MSGPLVGIKVLDLSRVLAGPYCTMTLGDLGADVIKVESPGGSDDTRHWGPPFQNNVSAYYLCANRNKRAITVNLKSEKGRQIIKDLAKQSDVLIHNFKYGTMEKWGLDYDSLKSINPGLIYCGITGFGKTGPYKHLPGYDFVIQAMSGLMSITGTEESGPMKVGVAISDVLTGMNAVIGILAALNERNQSGLGQSIDLALFDSQVSALVNAASNYLVSGKVPKRLGNEHPNIVPYQTFKTKDREMAIAVGNDGQFKRMCSAMGLDSLPSDERFLTNEKRLENRKVLTSILSDAFQQENASHWQSLLNQAGVPCGPINDMKAVFDEEQIQARNMLVEVDHPEAGKVSLVGSPIHYSRTPVSVRKHPPMVGEHTEEVLKELGLKEYEINSLKAEKVI